MATVYNSQLVGGWFPAMTEMSSQKTQDAFDLYHQWNERRRSRSAEQATPGLPALGHALAGSIGASVSNVATYPLDLIITRLQIQRHVQKSSSVEEAERYTSIRDAVLKIYKQEGFNGFYTGIAQDTLKSAADSFLFFLVYNSLRQARLKSRQRRQHLPVFDELGVGFVAGAAARFFTMPISAIVTRLQTTSMTTSRSSGIKGEAPSVRSIIQQIRSEKGLRGFWSGYSATLVLTLNPSLTFFFFEKLKRILLPQKQRSDPGPMITFFIAALSKVLASTITYPFSLAKTRTQVSTKAVETQSPEGKDDLEKGRSKESKASSISLSKTGVLDTTILGTILRIARTESMSSLYEGLEGEVLKGFFSHGITMLMKDAVHGLIIRLYFVILRLLNQYPRPSDLARLAKERAQDALEFVEAKSQNIAESAGIDTSRTAKMMHGRDSG